MTARDQVRAYFAKASPQARRALGKIRAAIRAAAPRAEEALSYRIPAFRFEGRILVWYAAFTHHTSLFPVTGKLRRALGKALRGYEAGKGTVRFPLAKPVPTGLVRKVVKARIADLTGASHGRPTAKRSRTRQASRTSKTRAS